MSKRVINIGSAPNDGTGDPLRTGLDKVNKNFTEIYDTLGDGNNVISYASTAGISTLAENLTGVPSIELSGLTNTGVTTTQSVETTDLNVAGVVTALKYFGDGSQLLGVVGTENGVDTYEDGIRRGVAKQLNFAENIRVSAPDAQGRVDISVSAVIGSGGTGGGGGGGLDGVELRDDNVTLGDVTKIDFGNFLDVTPISVGIATINVNLSSKPYDTITASHISNWDSAYSWGNHATRGYLTSYTETDTLDRVVGRGNSTSTPVILDKVYYANVWSTLAGLQTVDASVYHGMFAHAHDTGHGYFAHAGEWKQLIDENSSILELADTPSGPADGGWEGNILRYRTATSDWRRENPIALGINTSDINNWNAAYNWGDHSTAGYLSTDFTGNVGIAGTVTLTGEMMIDGYKPIFKLRDDNGLAAFGADTNYAYLEYNAEEGPALYFRLRASTSTPTFRMQSEGGNFGLSNPIMQEMVTINGGHPQNTSNWGYVGLNYPNPSERLHVNGSVKVVNGHFDGNGSQLTNIPTSGISGLQGYVDGRINAIGFSGDYNALINRPTIPQVLNDLNNVNAPTPSAGQVLKWSGEEWQAAADTGGGGSGSGIGYSDLSVTINPVGVASLSYNQNIGVFVYTPPDLSGYATTSSIPSLVGYATEGYVDNAIIGFTTTGDLVGFITSGALVGYATEVYVTNYVDTQIGIRTFSGSYVDLRDKPTIPTNNNQLANGAGFVTAGYAVSTGYVTGILTSYALNSELSAYAKINNQTHTGITTFSDVILSNVNASGIGSFDALDIADNVVIDSDLSLQESTVAGLNNSLNLKLDAQSGVVQVVPDLRVDGNTNISGVVTANQFVGDGSNLTGITAEANIKVEEEGSVVGSGITAINFTGAGVTASVSGTKATIAITGVEFSGAATSITSTQISNWDTSYGWGDHSTAGYAASTNVPNWDQAYSWGDHATVGYVTTGGGTFTGNVSFGSSALFGDNQRLVFGDNAELMIFHNGTNNNSVISALGTTESLNINAQTIRLKDATGTETYAQFVANGAVDLYYDNSKKLETIGTGVTVIGNAYATRFYGDGSSLSGITTSQIIGYTGAANVSGIDTTGVSEFTHIKASGIVTASRFESNQSGTPSIDSPNNLDINAVTVSISTDLTVGNRLSVGIITAQSGNISIAHTTVFEKFAYFGAGENLRLHNDGNNSIVEDVGSGSLVVGTNGPAVRITKGNNSENMAIFNIDGSSELYHDGLKKFETTSLGSKVTGNIESTGIATAVTYHTNDTLGDGSDVGFAIKYSVTANGASSYRFSGPGLVNSTDNPTFYLQRGFSYIFVNTTGSGHPFRIQFTGTTTGVGTYVSGSQTGTQIFTVPFDAPSSYEYQCTLHGGMKGTFNVA